VLERRAPQGGFTLVEMMVALAVFALLVLAALPNFRIWMQNTQIRTAAEGILNGLQFARAEAVRRNVNVELQMVGTSGWNARIASSGQIVQSRTSGEGSGSAAATVFPAGATKTTFNGLGRQVTNLDGSEPITHLAIDSSAIPAADTRQLCITVGTGGVVRMCDPQVAESDTRACLPFPPPAGC
jgi:type IV fimbrial biogenesis protein FimT